MSREQSPSSNESAIEGAKAGAVAATEPALSFALNFLSGRGLLSTRERALGNLNIKLLELEIPHIAFPFDVTGGAERFKNKRCLLKHLVFSLDGESINRALATAPLSAHGFIELSARVREGHLELAGRFKAGEAEADFTMRAATILRSPEELAVVFYDTRLYGPLPVPAALFPVYLGRALALPYVDVSRAGMWVLRPIERFARRVLPESGWKIPDIKRAHLVTAEVARGRVSIAAGPEPEPNERQLQEREPEERAVIASEGMIASSSAEQALARGDIEAAWQSYRDAFEEGRGGRWARERLLQLGAADPEVATDTRQLAEEALAEDPEDTQALTTLAALALRERSFGEAANRFSVLAELAHARKEQRDIVAAELAAAAAALPIDPRGALIAYERAAARAKDSIPAHAALFELRLQTGDHEGAIKAGERLLRLLARPEEQARVHRELGKVHRLHLRDFKQARAHFERALRLMPEDPEALEGLAETYAARGEPGRAASYLGRLAEQAESSNDKARIVALNLRLGDIWERWLADPAAAATRYYRVLDADDKNRQARLRLAHLCEKKGELVRARTLYEDIIATAEDADDLTAIGDIVAAYVRLSRLTLSASGPSAEAAACLERALELDPTNTIARKELGEIFRLTGEWTRLIEMLVDSAKVAKSPEEARDAYVQAARLELLERKNPAAAEAHLALVLTHKPDDDEALSLLAPLLVARQADDELVRRLYDAAAMTLEPERKAELLWQIAKARRSTPAAQPYLLAALDANPYLLAAARALVENARDHGDAEQRAQAFVRLAVAEDNEESRARALYEAGDILYRELGRPREAEAVLREAAILAEDNVQAWLALASLQNDLGQLDAARASLETALASKLNDAAARTLVHEKLAELYERLSDPEKQAQQLLAAMAHGADSAKLRPKLAKVLASLGRKDELVTLLETWAANAEGELADNLRREAAALCEELGQVTRAEGLLREVVLGKRAAAASVARDLERIAHARSDHGALAEALSYQLEIAGAGERKPLLERLLFARVAAQDDFGAEASALELLELDPTYAPAHRQLAAHYEKTKAFDKALEHWLALIYETRREDEDKLERRQAFEHAAALALEIAPEHTGRLRNSFDREHPEAPPSAVTRPYGELLAERGAFEELLALRRFQIAKEGRLARAEWRREAADILHHHLGRSAEAITYYQDVVAHQPDDAEARDALADILETLGRNNDLANLLFAMSQLVSDGDEALAYGQKSAEIYAERLADEVSAAQVLRLVATRPDVDPDAPKLHAMLRRYGLFDELASLLERSIGAAPDPDDGRFVALVALLHKELKDPTRALAWCERMIEAFADADKPRRLQVDLLIATAAKDQAQRALHAWAEARTGAARATVLFELSRLLITAGRTGDGIAALEQAAEADPKAEVVLEELIERSTAVGDFPRALAWLIKLARAKDPGVTQDELWRRVAQIATDYVDDLDAVAQALEGITHRTEEETRTLVELLAERGMLDALGALAGTAGGLPVDLSLKAGAALANGGMIDKARIFLEQAMARGEHRAVWEAAERGYRAAGKLEELGRWRLQAAKRSTATEAALLRLQGYADIAEAGHASKEGLSPSLFESLAGEIDATSADGAWALFRAARAFAQPQWTDTAMRTLEKVLTEDDPRLLLILHHRIESALTTRAHDPAVKLAERLLILGDPDADLWMERVLIAAGRRDDLLRYLLRRAEAEGEHAALLWIRIARWYCDDKQWAKAKVALERVPGAGRSLAWGELMCEVAVAVGDTASEAEGATVCAELAADAAARAAWLRRAGRLWWWRLEEAERGQKMLVHAQALAPIDTKTAYEEARTALDAGKQHEAMWLLTEATTIFEGAEAAPFHVFYAELALAAKDPGAAKQALARGLELADDDVALLVKIATQAQAIADVELALLAYRRAQKLDHTYDEPFANALAAAHAWDELLVFLQARAEAATGAEAANLYERAAELCASHLEDEEQALTLYMRSLELTPSASVIQRAYELAVRRERIDLVAHTGTLLLERLAPSAKARGAVLRQTIDALDATGRAQETRVLREELLLQKTLQPRDKLALARLYAPEAPARAAPLLTEAALDPAYEEQPALLAEAARLWLAQGDKDRAAAMLAQAITRGDLELATHRLAVELLTGPLRLASLQRLIDAGDDEAWPAADRALARLEIAISLLERGAAEEALELLEKARRFARVPQWAESMERALSSLERELELATLWLDEVEADTAPWSGDERRSRLQRAVEIFRQHEDAPRELAALDAVLVLDPTSEPALARISELAINAGDEQRYTALQSTRLARAMSHEQRAKLAEEAFTHLVEHFHSPDGAVALLTPVFLQHPSLELAALIERVLAARERSEELPSLLQSAAAVAEDETKPALLAYRGRLLSTRGAGDEAFESYRAALALDPAFDEALAYCVSFAKEGERFDEAVALLEGAAAVAPSFALWHEAAVITREHLDDPIREISSLRNALAVDPAAAEVASRIATLCLEAGDLDTVMELLLKDRATNETALVLGPRLVTTLVAKTRQEDAETLMQWYSERYADTEAASAYRLTLARQRGDAEALLAELAQRLRHADELSAKERSEVRLEAARASLRLGKKDDAAAHLFAALTDVGDEVARLFEIFCVTAELGDAKLEQEVAEHAARLQEEVFAETATAAGPMRERWLELLGRAREAAGDDANALSSYREALALVTTGPPPRLLVAALQRLYTRQRDFLPLAELFELLGRRLEAPKARAAALLRAATLFGSELEKPERTEACLRRVLSEEAHHPGAELAYGMLLSTRGRHAEALPYLQAQLATAEEPSLEQLMAWAESLRQTGAHAESRDVIDKAIAIDPERIELYEKRAEAVEKSGDPSDAEAAWLYYAQMLPQDAAAKREQVYRRLATLAQKRADAASCISYLEQACRVAPEAADLIGELRGMYEHGGRFAEAAELRLREASLAVDPKAQAAHFSALAKTYREHLDDAIMAAAMLEKAAELLPKDHAIAEKLVALYQEVGNWPQLVVAAERLLRLDPARRQAPFLAQLSLAYEESGDLLRAKELVDEGAALDGDDLELKARRRSLALRTGDYRGYVALEEKDLTGLVPSEEKLPRLLALADVYLKHLEAPERAARALAAAQELEPQNALITRRVADLCAVNPKTYAKAAEAYRSLLLASPLDVDLLRILARLYGQLGETDRAYGYYAALLVLLADDPEARRFVEACREARPSRPQRALTDADRAAGLLHPAQSGPIEELYTPLARFAELAQPSELSRRGLGQRDVLPPTDPKREALTQILEVIGLPEAELYTWRGGTYACELELTNPPAILIGSMLLSDTPERQRDFLVARAAELYRGGHSLCEKLSNEELGGLLAALTIAVTPAATPSGATRDTPRLAEVIGAPMNPQIRATMAPRVDAYVKASNTADITAWRRAAAASASRAAMLISCDVEEALSSLLRLRGFDDIDDEQRLALLREAQEELDLLRFAMSEEYFALREALGLALKRSK